MQEAPHGARPSGRAPVVGPAGARPAASVLQGSDPEAVPSLWGRAFPAATWRPVLGARTVHVSAGGATAQLLGAQAGRLHRLGPVVGGRRDLTAAELDHDWLWLDGTDQEVTWSLSSPVELPPLTVVLPTYRRETDAVAQARRFLDCPEVTAVLVVDQGGTLAEHPGFRALLERSPGLRLLTQPNLGGSGGYARGMLEASRDPSAAVLFSDDDAVLSPESLRRMLTYQALAPRPTIVGAPLFSSHRPSQLIAHSERVDPRAFQWGASRRMFAAVDLADTTPVDWTFTSPRAAVNYTGWWGTLFPPGTAADLGLPAPLFLKWDDAEYGLRATAHGYRHAVLPGTAVHHPPWTAYRTQMTWTARVLHRNRLAVAAAYGAGRGVLASSLLHQIKHVLAGHLLTAELWEEGIDAMRAGPGSWLGGDLEQARAAGARVVADWHRDHELATAPTPTRHAPLPLVRGLARAGARLLRADRPPRVVLAVPMDEMHWRTTLGADALLITDPHGATEAAFAVTGSAMRRALGRTLRSHLDLAVRWRRLSRRYRRALPQHTTADAWTAVFGHADPDRPGQER